MHDASIIVARWMACEVQRYGSRTFTLRYQTAEDLTRHGFATFVDKKNRQRMLVRMTDEQSVMFLLFDGEQSC